MFGSVRTVSRIACTLVGGFVLATVASCGNADLPPVFVMGVLAPPTPTGSSTCVYMPDANGPFLSAGSVDFAFTREYTPILLLANQLTRHCSPDNYVAPTEIVVLAATVRINDTDGNELDRYTIAGAGFISPPTGGQLGLGTYATTLVSSTVADRLGMFSGTKRLISYVAVYGRTYDGSPFESGWFSFPIDVCFGCLVTFPATADDPTSAIQPNCDATSSANLVPPCVLGQDRPIDCRLCASTSAPFAPPNVNVCEP